MGSQPPVPPDRPDLPQQLRTASEIEVVDRFALEDSLVRHFDISGSVAADVRVAQSRLDEVDLDGSNLARLRAEDLSVVAGSWANTELSDARLRRVVFDRVRMTGVNLAGAELKDVAFVGCRADLASFRFAKLEHVVFDGCRLDEVDFHGAKLQSVLFQRCSMTSANWAEADLERCEIRDSDISGSGNPERLRGVRMPWVDVLNAAGVLAIAAGIEIVD